MQNPKGSKSHQVAVWLLHTIRLKIRGSHLTCKIENKCLNVCERMKLVERNIDNFLSSSAVL